MYTTNNGFTAIEVMIAAAIVLGLIGFNMYGAATGKTNADAEAAMTYYVADLHPELQDTRVRCASYDSDGDGYIRCTATGVNESTVSRETITAECNMYTHECAPIKARLSLYR